MQLTLYQAEWCPFSSAVREVLTELGLEFTARQVEPWPEQRAEMKRATGTDSIPVLVADGEIYEGTRAIFRFLEHSEPWEHAAAHRERFEDHLPARESDAAGQLVARFRNDFAGDAGATLDETQVVDAPDENRYELRLGDRLVGLVAYRRRDSRIVLTHTEVDAACEGRGFGSRLVEGALDDARRQGLEVVPLCSFVAAFIRRHPDYAS
jgi:predicted GNAT family acetyltransferase/glutaredoxin